MNPEQSLSYGVIGTGPIGSIFATCLKQSNHHVSLLCIDEERLQQLKGKSIQITGALKAQATVDELYTDFPSFLGSKPDVILIATKSCDSPALLKKMHEIGVQDKTVFISCQNGLDVEEQVAALFGAHRALRMVINIGAQLKSPTQIAVSFCHTHFLSVRKEVDLDLTKQIADDFNRGGLKVEATENYKTEVYKKAILNASLGSVCALSGCNMRCTMEDEELSQIVKEMVREETEIAKSAGAPLPPDFLEYALNYFAQGGEHKPSILTDIEQGRHTENENHCGKLCQVAKEKNVKAPVTKTVYLLLKNLEKRRTQK